MPEFEKYANESPEAARRRISKNIQAKGKPGAPMAPRTKSSMMRKGYNFTRNLGGEDLPDIGL